MNYLFILFSLLFQTTPSHWLTDLKEGETTAASSNKLIVLNFSGSDWCGPCIRLKKEIFESEAFEKYADEKLVLINADFPRYRKNQLPQQQIKQNEALAEQYNAAGKFPFTLLMDANGKVLKEWNGLPNETPEKFVEEIKAFDHAAI